MMNETKRMWVGLTIALAITATVCPSAMAEVKILGVQYRQDKAFPEYRGYWHEDSNLPEDEGKGGAEEATAREPLGVSLHVLVRNDGTSPLAINDVEFAGESLKQCLVFSDQRKERKPASIFYANLPKDRLDKLIAAGDPIWFKIDPKVIAPGGTGQVVVRLRKSVETKTIRLALRHAGGAIPVDVPWGPTQPRVAGAYFSQDLKEVYLYFRHPLKGKAPTKILLDGQDVAAAVTLASDAGLSMAAGVLRLKQGLAPISFHVFQGIYDDGQTASAGLRAWCDEFAYGMFGGPGGKEDDEALAKQYFADLEAHNINIQMPQLGSSAVQAFLREPAGHQFAAQHGVRFLIDQPGKWGVRQPFMCWLKDEPDCADPKMKGVPANRMVGLLAQWCLERADEVREAGLNCPTMINLDSTNKPHNWYVYGQTPDVLSIDPYYQPRLRIASWEHPDRMRLYAKASYVRIVSEIAESACEPNPLHVILYACSYLDGDKKRAFPFPTAESKRIEAYYAVGSGAKGLSYWWFSPATMPNKPKKDRPNAKNKVACGVGAGPILGDPTASALWREIGLLGAEFRTLGPVLVHSCPAPAEVQATKGLWVRSLLAGLDTMVLLVVNDQYTNSEKGTTYQPIAKASVDVDLPGWLRSPQAFEVTAEGTKAAKATAAGQQLNVDLGRVDLTRLIVITTDARLRGQLQSRYDAQFKTRVAKLMP